MQVQQAVLPSASAKRIKAKLLRALSASSAHRKPFASYLLREAKLITGRPGSVGWV
jgi:hypothetical protein